MLRALVFAGSARVGNFTQHVAKFVHTQVNEHKEWKAELVSPTSLGLDFSDEGTQVDHPYLKKLVSRADAYILVAPEYNHGYSGSLKYMLDMNLKQYIHKPVAFVGVSAGPWGGTRVIESLVPVVRELGMVATFTDTNITNVQEEIIEGEFKNPEKWQKRFTKTLEELTWMAKVLKTGRTEMS